MTEPERGALVETGEPGPPLAHVVRRPATRRWLDLADPDHRVGIEVGLAFVVLLVLAGVGLLLEEQLGMPSGGLVWRALRSKRGLLNPLVLGALLALHLVTRSFRARRGQAALFDDAIVTSHPDVLGLLTGGRARAVSRWRRVTGYRVYSDHVQLTSEDDWVPWLPSIRRAIPVADDDQRARVCAVLDERGVPQLG